MLSVFNAVHKLLGGMALSTAESADALNVAKSYAKQLGTTLDDFVFLIRNKQYEINQNLAIVTEGLSNPILIGDYVFRGTSGGSSKFLEVRRRLPEDNNDNFRNNRAINMPLYQPDQINNASYTRIHYVDDH